MKENSGERRGSRGRRRFRHDYEASRVVVPPKDCSVCGVLISEMVSAVAWGADRLPAHFDCVLQELSKRETLLAEEKIAYLGSGLFGVIVEKENSRFEIHRKIMVDDPQTAPEWRKEIRTLFKR
jgi:hypothetical protein